MSRLWIGALCAALAHGLALAATPLPVVDTVPLDGHVLSVLPQAKSVATPMSELAVEPLTLTVVLRNRDEAGLDRYLADVYDAKSPRFRTFLTLPEITERFGPTREDYAAVEAYFVQQGFTLAEGSTNRLTLTLRGTRDMAERALSVRINDYTLDKRTFYANDTEPRLPADIASRVEAVVGLSNLATPRPQFDDIIKKLKKIIWQLCRLVEGPAPAAVAGAAGAGWKSQCGDEPTVVATLAGKVGALDAPVPWNQARGNGQKVGIVAFDSFAQSDVADYLALMGYPAAQIGKLSQVHVNGGAPLGPDQSEVLLDVTQVMTIATGASVVVYDAPFTGGGTSFQSIFNAMINDHVTVISNSWAYCEDQTTLADVTSIDTIFKTAAAAGISVFNATGDSGSTCLDGAANTITVPAGSPSATAVGGTSLTSGPGFTYVGETWWNGTAATPQTGQGGFGVSRFFARPSYQDGVTASPMRSIPDVSVNADPETGPFICQASAGGCPTGALFGGTSIAAPIWAAFAAIMNEAQGTNLGFVNPLLYPLASTNAFHGPASMGSDFAHVGLGSPNINRIHLALSGQSAGQPVAATSGIVPYADGYSPVLESNIPRPPADGTTPVYVVVYLRDANGNMVSGKTVTLAASPGTGVTIAPASGVTSLANGAVVFTVTNTTPGEVTFTATDTTDGLTLTPQTLRYAVPAAASGGISAAPINVVNNGVATTTITVTLRDALDRPTPGKLVSLAQGTGHSIVTGPSPALTDAAGQVQFTATNTIAETVTYTATDITDGNLAIPGSAVVTFGGQGSFTCVNPNAPTAATGYALTPWSTGYINANVFYGNVNAGCRGVQNPAFTTDGAVLTTNFVDGSVFRLPASGGIADSGTRIATLGTSLFQPVTGKDGKVYVTRMATTGNFTTGALYEIDPVTGAILRTVLANLVCPTALAVDPLSGDLFFDDSCFGAGADNPSIWRVHNPGSASPTLSVYYTLPATPTGWLAFAPDGTLYVPQYVTSIAPVLRITGTDKPQPATSTPVPGLESVYWVTVGEALPSGAAKSLIVLQGGTIRLADITTDPPTFTDLIDNGPGSGIVGPDGCLYVGGVDIVYKLAPAEGGCGFVTSVPVPGLALTPPSASATQGSKHTLTAQFTGAAPAAGTPVFFSITGANAQTLLATTDATGKATVSYTGALAGADAVKATSTPGATTLTSSSAAVTWTPGKHATYVSTNPSPESGTVGVPLALRVQLIDSSTTPNVAIAGATVQLALGALSCVAVTDAQGFAACTVVPDTAGMQGMTASYAGSAAYAAASASTQVAIVAAVSSLAAVPSALDFGSVAVGSTSATMSVAITNGGTAVYTPASIALGGTHAQDFAVTGGSGSCAVAAPIAAGGTCRVYLVFQPTGMGARTATLALNEAAGSPFTVPLTGTGTAAPSSCYTDAVSGGSATACVTGTLPGCTFATAAFVPVSSVGVPAPAGLVLPYGLFRFEATGCGTNATVTITYPAPLPAGTQYWKYGPTSAVPAGLWYTLPATVSGHRLTVTFTDGGAGDSDLVADGTIRDPGGAAYAAAPVATEPIPTLDRTALIMLTLALAMLARRKLARRT